MSDISNARGVEMLRGIEKELHDIISEIEQYGEREDEEAIRGRGFASLKLLALFSSLGKFAPNVRDKFMERMLKEYGDGDPNSNR